MEFPPFRSAEWLNHTFQCTTPATNKSKPASSATPNESLSPPSPSEEVVLQPSFFVPVQMLSGVTLSPAWMKAYETVNHFKARQKAVQEEIRRALFRQALFKIQNVEVMYMKKCPSNRVLLGIHSVEHPTNLPYLRPKGVDLLKEELWWVQRCHSVAKYTVRYYTEGENGYSCQVWPRSFLDWVQQIRYYYTAPTADPPDHAKNKTK